jgi:hypothetical protein
LRDDGFGPSIRRMDDLLDTALAFALPLFLVWLAGWVLGVMGFFKARRALNEVAALRRELAQTRAAPIAATAPELPTAMGEAPVSQQVSRPGEPAPLVPETAGIAFALLGESPPTGEAEPVSAGEPEPPSARGSVPIAIRPPPGLPPPASGPSPPAPGPIPPRIDIEALLTMRWGVWLGAVALVMAGVFLVRYAAEQGMLGPGPRCVLAGVLGLALIVGAEWLRRWENMPSKVADQAAPALAASRCCSAPPTAWACCMRWCRRWSASACWPRRRWPDSRCRCGMGRSLPRSV